MGLGNPPPRIKIMLESNPLKSMIMLVGRLAVARCTRAGSEGGRVMYARDRREGGSGRRSGEVEVQARCGNDNGKRDSIHHHLLETISETANALELRQQLLHTTPSGWWGIKSLFRDEGVHDRGVVPSHGTALFRVSHRVSSRCLESSISCGCTADEGRKVSQAI